MEIPKDVELFLKDLESRRITVRQLAIERTPLPNDTYDVWECERVRDWKCDWKYLGVRSADDAYREPDKVVCHKLTCNLFLRRSLELIYDREERKVHEPEEW
jgi:hypothetical protein